MSHEYQSCSLWIPKHHFSTSLEGLELLLQGHCQQTPPTAVAGIFRKDFHQHKTTDSTPFCHILSNKCSFTCNLFSQWIPIMVIILRKKTFPDYVQYAYHCINFSKVTLLLLSNLVSLSRSLLIYRTKCVCSQHLVGRMCVYVEKCFSKTHIYFRIQKVVVHIPSHHES